MTPLNLMINGKAETLSDPSTVQDVLSWLKIQGEYFAVAVNLNCVPRSQYSTTLVKDGDQIEILTPMQGG